MPYVPARTSGAARTSPAFPRADGPSPDRGRSRAAASAGSAPGALPRARRGRPSHPPASRLRGSGGGGWSLRLKERFRARLHPVQLQLLPVLGGQRVIAEPLLDPLFVPDDEVVGVAENHHVVGDAGYSAEHGRDEHASLRVYPA